MKKEIFIEIEKKNIAGFKEIQLLRREPEAETEFTTIMRFEGLESVKQFAGENYETAYVLAKAREVLASLMHDQRIVKYAIS